jgi:hypothetical protein
VTWGIVGLKAPLEMEKAPCNGAFESVLLPPARWGPALTSSATLAPHNPGASPALPNRTLRVWERVCAGGCAPHPLFMAFSEVPPWVSTCPSAHNPGGRTMLQSVPLARIEPIKINAGGESLMSVSVDRYLSEVDDRSEALERVFEIFELTDEKR